MTSQPHRLPTKKLKKRENVTSGFNPLITSWFVEVTNFFVSSLTSLLQNKLFWSSKPISLQCKTYHLADQNNLFCFRRRILAPPFSILSFVEGARGRTIYMQKQIRRTKQCA